MSLYSELKRRNVIRVATAYVVASWLIIQVVETLFPVFGVGDQKIRLVVIVLAIAFIPTLVFSWAFEITPEGLKREVDEARETSITRFTGKKIDRVIMLLLAVAVGYFAFDKFVLEPARDAELVAETAQQARSDALVESYGDKSIAVLPFVNMSADPEQEYFSDGISEELLNLLARIPELRVISRTSSFRFRGEDVAIPEVAKQLNVGHVLEGSIRRDGNRFRITAVLIEARSDTNLWSRTFEGDLENIFAVQYEIAVAIGKALKFTLLGPVAGGELQTGSVRVANPEAYDAYLVGRELTRWRNPEGIEHLRRSLRLDDSFAPAHAQLAISLALSAPGPEEAKLNILPHLRRALELDPHMPEVYGAQALMAVNNSDFASAERFARQALELNPNYNDAMNWLQIALSHLGRWDEAEATLKRMLATDPLAPLASNNYASLLAWAGRFEEAREQADLLLMRSQRAGSALHSTISFLQGDVADGLYWGLRRRAASRRGWNLELLMGFTWIGEYAEARRVNLDLTLWPDSAAGRVDDAIEVAELNARAFPEYACDSAGVAGFILYMGRRIEEARPHMERFFECIPRGRRDRWGFFLFPGDNEMFMRLAHARRMSGDEEGANAVAGVVRQEQAALHSIGESYSFVHRADAMIAAFDQQPERVVAALELALKNGHRDPQLFDDPIFDDMRSDPSFVAVESELGSILAAERDKTLQMICFDNPVPDDWQPLPDTCTDVESH